MEKQKPETACPGFYGLGDVSGERGVGQCTIGGPGLPGIRKNEKRVYFCHYYPEAGSLYFIRDLLFLLFISGMFVLFHNSGNKPLSGRFV